MPITDGPDPAKGEEKCPVTLAKAEVGEAFGHNGPGFRRAPG